MAQDVINLLFAGDSHDMLTRYAEGARRYREAGGTAPEQFTAALSDEGLLVSLVWAEGVSHEGLGRHMIGMLDELGLPFPRVSHGELALTSWDTLTGGTQVSA